MATQNIFNLTDTWNNVATTFTAIKMNATDTASAAGSLLLDLQVGGVSKFKADKSGGLTNGVVTSGAVETVTALNVGGTSLSVTSYGATSGTSSVLFRKGRGTTASPAQTLSGDQIFTLIAAGVNNTPAASGNAAALQFMAAGDFTTTSTPTKFAVALTAVGSVSRRAVLSVDADGGAYMEGGSSLGAGSFFAPNALKGTLTTVANATTGLVPGALAALTNASIVITDGAGQVYRVPCII